MFSIKELSGKIKDAAGRIRKYTKVTPVLESSYQDKKCFLKLENEQHTGSFKARGSLNKVLSLTSSQKQKGVITASTGNHGLGVARALKLTETQGTVYLPKDARPAKVEKLRALGAGIRFVDGGPLQSELAGKDEAARTDATWISPYNDIEVIAGQGTIGIELLDQLPRIKRVFITVGGGGLISGVGAFLKAHVEDIEVIGCVPENSPEMMLSVEAGHIVHLTDPKPTLSDGSAGGAEDGSITFDYCRILVDQWIQVPEKKIASAMKYIYDQHGMQVEGSAGVAYAAWQQDENPTECDAVIICGGNIEESDFLNAIH